MGTDELNAQKALETASNSIDAMAQSVDALMAIEDKQKRWDTLMAVKVLLKMKRMEILAKVEKRTGGGGGVDIGGVML